VPIVSNEEHSYSEHAMELNSDLYCKHSAENCVPQFIITFTDLLFCMGVKLGLPHHEIID